MRNLILLMLFGVLMFQNTKAQNPTPTIYVSGNTMGTNGTIVPNAPINIYWQTACDSGSIRVFADTTIYSNASGYYFFSFPNDASNNCTTGMNIFYVSNDCGFAETHETTPGVSYQYGINVPACTNANPCDVSFSYTVNPNMVYTFIPSTTLGSPVAYIWEFTNFNISNSNAQSPQAYLINGASYGIVNLIVRQNGIICTVTDTIYSNNNTTCDASFTIRPTSAAGTYQFIPNQNLSNVATYQWTFNGFNITSSSSFDPTASLLPTMPPMNCGTVVLSVTLNTGVSCTFADSICDTDSSLICNANFTYTQTGNGRYRFEADDLTATNFVWNLQGFTNVITNNRIAEASLASGSCGIVVLTATSANGLTCSSTQQVCFGNTNVCVDSGRINRQIVCPTVNQPVCGCDNVTYNNACEAENWYGITQYQNGPCGGSGGGVVDSCSAEFGVQWNLNNNEFVFNGIYHSVPSSSNVQYFWDFGDGTTDVGQNIGHVFPSNGAAYQVCLTAIGGNCSAQYCHLVYVPIDTSNSGNSCAASFTYTGYVASNTNQLIYVFNPQTYGQQALSTTWSFSYGGQTFTSTDRNPVIILPVGVTQISVCLEVVYVNNCVATSCDQFLIRQTPFHVRGNVSRLVNALREGLATRGLQPEAGVVVHVKDVRGTVFRQVVTDANGNYDIPNLSEGNFIISLGLEGYSEIEQLISSKNNTGDVNNINYIIYDESNYATGVQSNVNQTINKITVSPNPASESVRLEVLTTEKAQTKLQVIANTGQVVIEETLVLEIGENTRQIDINALPSGMYFVRVGNISTKIMKQ